MCSISGFISHKSVHRESAFRLSSALLFYGRTRGEQSSGVWSAGLLHKEAVSPTKFIDSKKFEDVFAKETNLVMNHTRQPTCGGLTDEQAQPFINGDVVTTHNGWYTNRVELKNKWKIDKASGVDSELITSYVASYGIKALPTFLKSAEGSSAIAIKDTTGLYFAVAGNPLAYTSIPLKGNNRVLVWASTSTILENALKYIFLLERPEIKEVDDGGLYRVTPKEIVKIADIERPVQIGFARHEYSHNNWDAEKGFWDKKHMMWRRYDYEKKESIYEDHDGSLWKEVKKDNNYLSATLVKFQEAPLKCLPGFEMEEVTQKKSLQILTGGKKNITDGKLQFHLSMSRSEMIAELTDTYGLDACDWSSFSNDELGVEINEIYNDEYQHG